MTRNELEKRIAALPGGGITVKKINGRSYPYYQWTENGKQHGRRVREDELARLTEQIEERKRLKSKLRDLEMGLYDFADRGTDFDFYGSGIVAESVSPYVITTRLGDELVRFSAPVKGWKKRSCFGKLREYIYGEARDKVFILYGLRRTGKTTLIRQLIGEMDGEMLSKTAFLQAGPTNDLGQLNRDLRLLENNGYRYVFIDEVTLMSDFVEGAALLSDIFAASGMRIVLSGTDSLGFVFSEDEQLYDRCVMLHTTNIGYAEFSGILGGSLDDYIRYGGTMSAGGGYNDAAPFTDAMKAGEYVNSAIARNIQHSLSCYRHGGHFRNLRELYDRDELTGAINRVVEDINHRFTVDVLTREFFSNDYAISASNLRRDRTDPTDILDRVDREAVTEKLRKMLEIRNAAEQQVGIKPVHAAEIKEYLYLLDLMRDIPVLSSADLGHAEQRTVICQPGLRYAQAEALIRSLMRDTLFASLSAAERGRVVKRMLSEIKGRMLEDIVLLDTTRARQGAEVFKLQFDSGEFDMVIADPEKAECEIFEIKHSSEINAGQYRHLLDTKKCGLTEFRFGQIKGKYVIYGGRTRSTEEGIQYINAEEYLKRL